MRGARDHRRGAAHPPSGFAPVRQWERATGEQWRPTRARPPTAEGIERVLQPSRAQHTVSTVCWHLPEVMILVPMLVLAWWLWAPAAGLVLAAAATILAARPIIRAVRARQRRALGVVHRLPSPPAATPVERAA